MSVKKRRSKTVNLAVVAANVLLIICVVVSVTNAFGKAQKVSFSQNIENIRTLTDASAEKIELEFKHHMQELQRVADYINTYKGDGMTKEQLLDFFDEMYAPEENPDYRWELTDSVLNDTTGASRGFTAIRLCDAERSSFNYSSQSYPELAKIFCAASEETLGVVKYTSEFTDPSPSLDKASSVACAIRLKTESGYDYKTLMLLIRSDYVSELLSANNDLNTMSYFNYSNIIVDDEGDYVISNTQFQGTNFMDYIRLYNKDFSTEDIAELKQNLHSEDFVGVLYYDNNRGQPCAYTIVPVQDTYWHILSIVPLNSFHNEYHFSDSFLSFGLFFGMLFILDITVVAFINRQLRRKTKEAQAASEAKTDFLSRMSHDIRTPINVINGMTELAMQEGNPPATMEYLNDIRSASGFLLGLVNDILDMNKVESGKMELFPVPYPYQEFKSYINAIITPMCVSKEIDFTVQCNHEDVTLSLDKMRLNQIVFNLLSNAVKFTPKNGKVSLDTTVTRIGERRALLEISVADNGIGMSEEFQKTMFSAFSQESRPEERQILGTGLGLAIVKNLVGLMNGSIDVKSAIGQGTSFLIRIEADFSDTQAAPAQDGDYSIDSLRGKRVLLCEDQPMNTKIIVRLLGINGIDVDTAENGKIGVDTLTEAVPGYYSAVLMDVRMPVMNGLEASRAIRAAEGRPDLRTIPIIALTANAYDSDVRACLDAGMNEHLAKPIDKRLLFEALARQIHGQK